MDGRAAALAGLDGLVRADLRSLQEAGLVRTFVRARGASVTKLEREALKRVVKRLKGQKRTAADLLRELDDLAEKIL